MTLAEAIAYLSRTGCRLSRASAGISLTVPEGHPGVPADVATTLRDHREEILAILPEPAPATPGPTPASPPAWAPPPTLDLPTVVWDGQRLTSPVAFDCETSLLEPIPDYVLATAYDGSGQVYLVDRARLPRFLRCHADATLVFHNGADFDLQVMAKAIADEGDDLDVLSWVDADLVVDTYILELLIRLATDGKAQDDLKGQATLAAVTSKYLGHTLDKDEAIRLTFGDFLGLPLDAVPRAHVTYAARDTVATWHVWRAQQNLLPMIRESAQRAYGFQSLEALDQAWRTYGPLSLFLQVRTAVSFEYMGRAGLYSDAVRRDEAAAVLEEVRAKAAATLEPLGLLGGGFDPPTVGPTGRPRKGKPIGKDTATQRYLEALQERLLAAGTITTPLARTESGKRIAFDAEAQAYLAGIVTDPVLEALATHAQCEKWLGTYLSKLNGGPVHPRWRYLTRSGRSSCDGDLAAQTLPKDSSSDVKTPFSVRQCVIPPPGHVFVGADYKTLEVAAFAYCLESQLKYGSSLANVVRGGADVHTLVAESMPGREPGPVTKQQRNACKAITFGVPGTLGREGLKRSAKLTYGVILDDAGCDAVVAGYKALNPEVDRHLAEDGNLGDKIAKLLGFRSRQAGWNAYNVVAGKITTGTHTAVWEAFARVIPTLGLPDRKAKAILAQVEAKQPGKDLAKLLRDAADQGSYITATGRLRSCCKFGATRNGVFQSIAADGCMAALWRAFREGLDIRFQIHDEIGIAVPATGSYTEAVDHLSRIMVEEMSTMLGGLPIVAEPFVRSSLSPADELPLEAPAPAEPEASQELDEDDPDWLPPPDSFFTQPTAGEPEPEAADANGALEVDGMLVGFTMGAGRKGPRKPKQDSPTRLHNRRGKSSPKAVSYDELADDLPF